ncbi:YT521-B-like domain-containing protein [Epithele typhae]|uniref:YT521-B-like domain-containing protein n=1 Tax=Epithele typhae TaxID=378194 RepID=UPI0020075F9E|nr:YT521-B-like domain-containing protein [Epithele typhae]KAH9931667.1 YT521-B-like domain-containing protein [Epithele typhae]
MSYGSVNTHDAEQHPYGQATASPITSTAFPSPASMSGPDATTTSMGPTALCSPSVQSPALPSYGHITPDEPPPLQRGRPPDTKTSPPLSPLSVASSHPGAERPEQAPRRAYHPNPPAQRSEWVAWAGNVPSDATHDELWRFFNSPPSPGSTSALSAGAQSTQSAPAGLAPPSLTGSSASTESLHGGVSSIFLITRSNCAFINFQTEAHLHAAIKHFNGVPLRPNDPRCPRLVCRIRGRDDDLKAGVGGQRGAGVHVRWVKEKREREKEALRRLSSASGTSTSSADRITSASMSPTDALHVQGLSLSSDDEAGLGRRRRPDPHSSSSGSYASTNSSILTTNFPKRYFILKSLTQRRERPLGYAASQRGDLEQAYRTSKEVYLIFSVNKSGEFYGYAKMAGHISRGEQQVFWASRTSRDSPTTKGKEKEATFFSPSEQRFDESPFPMSPESRSMLGKEQNSAPAEMFQPHHRLSQATEGPHTAAQASFDIHALRPVAALIATQHKSQSVPRPEIELDKSAPFRAMRNPETVESEERSPGGGRDTGKAIDTSAAATPIAISPRPPVGERSRAQDDGPTWGESFRIEWIRTDRLPFTRTRHLRNPWNHDREVKVSRDGTELEPGVGQALLDEWDKPEPPPPAASASVDVGRRLTGRGSISADVLSPQAHSRSENQKKEGAR